MTCTYLIRYLELCWIVVQGPNIFQVKFLYGGFNGKKFRHEILLTIWCLQHLAAVMTCAYSLSHFNAFPLTLNRRFFVFLY